MKNEDNFSLDWLCRKEYLQIVSSHLSPIKLQPNPEPITEQYWQKVNFDHISGGGMVFSPNILGGLL